MSGPAAHVRWLGHSTVLLEVDGARLLTDPLLRPWVLHLRRAAPLVAGGALDLDAVLISHLHYDHLDLPSLQRLDRGVTVVVPKGAGALVRGRGFSSVEEVEAGDSTRVGTAVVRATRAEHGSSRVLGARSEALGSVVEGSRRVYFPGDTDLFPEMAELAPGLDLALVPIWGWGPSLGPGHLDPRGAAEALALLRPRIAVLDDVESVDFPHRGADPLGDVLPGSVHALEVARVPQGAGARVRALGGGAGS